MVVISMNYDCNFQEWCLQQGDNSKSQPAVHNSQVVKDNSVTFPKLVGHLWYKKLVGHKFIGQVKGLYDYDNFFPDTKKLVKISLHTWSTIFRC